MWVREGRCWLAAGPTAMFVRLTDARCWGEYTRYLHIYSTCPGDRCPRRPGTPGPRHLGTWKMPLGKVAFKEVRKVGRKRHRQ